MPAGTPSARIGTESGRLQGVDLLRGVAILMVLAFHIPHDDVGRVASFVLWFGYLGVPLFILISGFCIHRPAALACAAVGGYAMDWRRFWTRRFVRLYPTYLAAIGFTFACAWLLYPEDAHLGRFLDPDLAVHLLLVHNLTSEFATTLGNAPLWSMGTEAQLYALYIPLLFLLRHVPFRRVLLLVAALTVCWRIAIPFLPEPGPWIGGLHLGSWYRWPLNYWLHWTLGAWAVEAWVRGRRLPDWASSPLRALQWLIFGLLLNAKTFDVAAGALGMSDRVKPYWHLLSVLDYMGELGVLLGFFCLLNWVLRREARAGGAAAETLAWVGRISYSIYLIHLPLISLLQSRVPQALPASPWPLRFLAYGALVLSVGFVFHVGVERWFMHGRWARLAATRVPG